jgi:hypothetical protein
LSAHERSSATNASTDWARRIIASSGSSTSLATPRAPFLAIIEIGRVGRACSSVLVGLVHALSQALAIACLWRARRLPQGPSLADLDRLLEFDDLQLHLVGALGGLTADLLAVGEIEFLDAKDRGVDVGQNALAELP